MRIERVHLNPFAGQQDRRFDFAPGLNVVLGNNEAGKTTLRRALECAFFFDVRLKKSQREHSEMRRLIPVGGDHATVRVRFSVQGRAYELEKTWEAGTGASARAWLKLPDGTELLANERIAEELNAALPSAPSAFRTVLLAGQGIAVPWMEQLKESHECLHALGDALRQAARSTDGISVDRLKALAQARFDDLFSNWDFVAGSPAGGRGLDQPHRKNVGRILAAHYRRESARRSRDRARTVQADLVATERRLGDSQGRYDALAMELTRDRPLVEAAEKRSSVSFRLEGARRVAGETEKDFMGWLQGELALKGLDEDLVRLTAVQEAFSKELANAQAEKLRREFRARFQAIRPAKEDLDEVTRELSRAPVLTRKEFEVGRLLEGRRERLKAGVSSGRLQLKLRPKVAMELTTRCDLADESRRSVSAGSDVSLSAGGRIFLETPDFELTVESGAGTFEQVGNELARVQAELDAWLLRHGLKTLDEARIRAENYEALLAARTSKMGVLEARLAGSSYEELAARFEADAEETLCRDPKVIQAEFDQSQRDLGGKKAERDQWRRRLDELERKYEGSKEIAFGRHSAAKTEVSALEMELGALPDLPGGHAEGFLREFRKKEQSVPALLGEVSQLREKVAGLRATLPSKGIHELEADFSDADVEFRKAQVEGAAIRRVCDVITRLEGDATDVYAPLQQELAAMLASFSADRYTGARFVDGVPETFARKEGSALAFEQLSAGTQDGFALCLRLAMAKYFLSDPSDGLLVLDDPMVAMDDGRRAVAADLIRRFAEQRQTLVLTCRPEHADLLGGNLIRL